MNQFLDGVRVSHCEENTTEHVYSDRHSAHNLGLRANRNKGMCEE